MCHTQYPVKPISGYAFYEWRIKSNTAATELPDDNHTSTSQQILPTYYHRTPTKATYTCSRVTTVFLITIQQYEGVWLCARASKGLGQYSTGYNRFSSTTFCCYSAQSVLLYVHPLKKLYPVVLSAARSWMSVETNTKEETRGIRPKKPPWSRSNNAFTFKCS